MADIDTERRERARIEAQALLDYVMGRGPDPRARKPLKAIEKSPHKSKRGENLRNRGPVHDYEEIVRTFNTAGTIADTARQLGIHRETVRTAINKAGLSSPPGRRRKEK